MSETDTFFDALEKRILLGEKLGTMKGFLITARDHFLALENASKAKFGRGKGKDFGEEIERLQAELEQARVAAYAAEKDFTAKLIGGRLKKRAAVIWLTVGCFKKFHNVNRHQH